MGYHFFMGEALYKGKGGLKYVTSPDLGLGQAFLLDPPPPPKKKIKKNKLQVICAVHNLGHEEFLICEIRSSVLSVKRSEQQTEISKCRIGECLFFFLFFF